MSLQVVFSRTLLSLPDLTITANPFGTDFWLPEGDFNEPEFSNRDTFADPSSNVPGSLMTQSVTDTGSFAASIYAQGTTEAALKANKRVLEATVRQFRFTTSLTIVGAADTYHSLRGLISWGPVDSGMTAALMARATVTIPVLPLEV